MASHLYIEIQIICITFFAVLLYRVHLNDDRRTSQLYFRILLICSMLTFFFDGTQAILASHVASIGEKPVFIFNVFYYISLGTQCYFWFLYSESEQESRATLTLNSRLIAAIPLVVLVVLAMSAPFNNLLFSIAPDGTYSRGPLHFVQLIISYCYLVPTSIKAFILARQANDYTTRHHLNITGSIIIPVIVCGVAQFFLPKLPIICAGCCDSLLFGYMAMQEENISVDPLTKVNNRRRLLRNLDTLIERAREEHKPFGVLMIDVDKFKSINDTYGHVEGDKALIYVANVLSNADEAGVRVYRYGGDEFILTSENGSESFMAHLAAGIQASVTAERERLNLPYNLAVSIGYTKFEVTDVTPNDIVTRADSKLYEEKHSKKSA